MFTRVSAPAQFNYILGDSAAFVTCCGDSGHTEITNANWTWQIRTCIIMTTTVHRFALQIMHKVKPKTYLRILCPFQTNIITLLTGSDHDLSFSTPHLSSDWPHSTQHSCIIETQLDHNLFTLYFQGNSPTLRMEAAYTSETYALVYNTKQCEFPGDYNLNMNI